jgi:hypothetical protein
MYRCKCWQLLTEDSAYYFKLSVPLKNNMYDEKCRLCRIEGNLDGKAKTGKCVNVNAGNCSLRTMHRCNTVVIEKLR